MDVRASNLDWGLMDMTDEDPEVNTWLDSLTPEEYELVGVLLGLAEVKSCLPTLAGG
jgi:hypothetical protein